jgi:hypothetical protein
MKTKPFPDDLVPLVSYSVRKDGSAGHGRDYKLLHRAIETGSLHKCMSGKNIWVSKSAADRILASSVQMCKPKTEPGSRCGVSVDDRVRALEKIVTDLCVQLGYTGHG